MENICEENIGELSVIESTVSNTGDYEASGSLIVDVDCDENGSQLEGSEDIEAHMTEEEIAAKDEAQAVYMKKLAANNAVKNLAAMFGKKAAPVEAKLKSRAKVDMSKFAKPAKADYGLQLDKLRDWKAEWSRELAQREESLQEMAVAKVRGFMDAVVVIVKLQSWIRMIKPRRKYYLYRQERIVIRAKFFYGWKRYVQGQQMRLHYVIGKPFHAWKDEVEDLKRLQMIVLQFFQTSIKKLRLTPQSVMCFFSAEKFNNTISETDINKIRRLILSAIFRGWRIQVRSLKTMQFRASQIISRMVRRTKGVLYSKEAVLVCFHLWKRYVAVRIAYRREELDPFFSQPLIPQWNTLYQLIIVQRIRKKRAAGLGQRLIALRTWKRWRNMMTMDKSQMLNPQQRADIHYSQFLSRCVIRGWFDVIRERGCNVRRRNKIFHMWANWAPNKRRMRTCYSKALKLAQFARKRTAYNVIKSQCYEVIGKRAIALKLVRQNICNRKLMVCAYALANHDDHVMFLDCWRRWQKYWRARWRWKSNQWQYQIQWYQLKLRAIMDAWKTFTVNSKREKEEALRSNGLNFILEHDDDHEHVEEVDTTEPTLMKGITHSTLGLFERSLRNICETVPDEEAFMLICRATTKSAAIGQKRRKFILDALARDDSVILQDDVEEESKSASLKKLKAAKDVAAGVEPVHNFDEGEEDNNVNSGLDDFISAPITAHESIAVKAYKDRQDKLQRAIEYFNLNAAATIIEEGAEVQQAHIRQLMARTGDDHLPFLGMLLGSSREYICERVRRRDRKKEVFYCHSPLGAMLVNSHLQRWENRCVSSREISQLTKGREITDFIGGKYQSNIMWRLVLLMLIKKRADDLQNTCMVLKENRSVDQEVAEVLKRQKIARLRANRDSIRQLFGIEVDPSGGGSGIPQLVKQNITKRRQAPPNFNSYVKSLDIYVLLKEFTLLTGKLTSEAVALRHPMMERDSVLLKNGLRKQYHADFQALKLDCMSEVEMKQFNNAKLKLEKQEALATKKRLAKEAKKIAQSQKPPLSTLLAHRDGGDVILTPSDQSSELIFTHRSLNFRNMILETWQPDAWRHKSETAKSTLVLRRRKESVFIYNRIIAFFSDLFPLMTANTEPNADYINPNLPDPRYLPPSGYGGYILMSVLKHMFPKEVMVGENLSSGVVLAPDEIAHRYMRGLKKWVPLDWWGIKRVKQVLTREGGIISRVVKEADIRAKTIHLANLKVGKQKTSHLSFLKGARNELLDITEKAGSILTNDRRNLEVKMANINNCEREIIKNQQKIVKNQAHVLALDRLISLGRVRELMELMEIRVPETLDEEAETALRFKAYGIVEEAKRTGLNLRCRVAELEAKKVELQAELKVFNRGAARGRRVMNEFAGERMTTIADVQQLVANAIKTQKNNDVEKSVEQQAKKIVQCYEDTIESLADQIFGSDAPKKLSKKEERAKTPIAASPVESPPKKGSKDGNKDEDEDDEEKEDEEKDGEEEEAVGEDEEALLRQSLQATDLVAAMEDQNDEDLSVSVESMVQGSSSEEEDDLWDASPKKTFDKKNAGGDDDDSVDSDDSDETQETIDSAQLKGIDSGAMGFGSSTYQEELQEEKLAGTVRKSSLTPGEIEAIECAKEEEASRVSEANAATELKMRVFDEYWFSLGEDIKGKREQKKKKLGDDSTVSSGSLVTNVNSLDGSVKGYGRTGKMFRRARAKKRRLKYKSVYDVDYVRPVDHAIVDDESITHQQEFLKTMELTADTLTKQRDETLAAMWRNDVPESLPNPRLFPNLNPPSRATTAGAPGMQFGGSLSGGGVVAPPTDPPFKLSVAIGMQCEDEATIILGLGLNKDEGSKKPLFGPMSKVGYTLKPSAMKVKTPITIVHDDQKTKSILDRKKKRKARNAAKVAVEGGVTNTAAYDAVSTVSKDDFYIQAGSVLAPTFKANRAHLQYHLDMLTDIRMDDVHAKVNRDTHSSRSGGARSPGIAGVSVSSPHKASDGGSTIASEETGLKEEDHSIAERTSAYKSPYRTPALSRQVSNVGLFYKVSDDGSLINESPSKPDEDDTSMVSSVSGVFPGAEGDGEGDDFDVLSKDGSIGSGSTVDVFPSLTEPFPSENVASDTAVPAGVAAEPIDAAAASDAAVPAGVVAEPDYAIVVPEGEITPRSVVKEGNVPITPLSVSAPPLSVTDPTAGVDLAASANPAAASLQPQKISPLGSPDADISLGGNSMFSDPIKVEDKADEDEPDASIPFPISHVRIMQTTTPIAGASRPTTESGHVSSAGSVASAAGSIDGQSRGGSKLVAEIVPASKDNEAMPFDDELDDEKSKVSVTSLTAEDLKTIESSTTGTVQGLAVHRLAGSHGGITGVSTMNRAPTHSVEEIAPKPLAIELEEEEEDDFVLPAVSAVVKQMNKAGGAIVSIKDSKLKHHTHVDSDSGAGGLVAVPLRAGSWMLKPKDPVILELSTDTTSDSVVTTTTTGTLEELFNETGRSLVSKKAPRRSGSIAPQKSPSIAPLRNGSIAPQRNASIAPQRRPSVASAPQKSPSIAPQRNASIAPQRKQSISAGSPGPKRRGSVALRNITSNSQVVGKSDYEEDESNLQKVPVLARGMSISGRQKSVTSNPSMANAMANAANAVAEDDGTSGVQSMEQAMLAAMMMMINEDDDFDDDYLLEEEAKKQALVDALGIRDDAESEDTKVHYAEAVPNMEPLRDTATHLLKWRSHHHGHINHGHLEQAVETQPLVSLTSLVEKTLEETLPKSEVFENKLSHICDDDEDGGYLAMLLRADALLQEEAAQKALQAKMAAAHLGIAKKEKKIFGFKHTDLNSISEVKATDLALPKELESIGKAREVFETEEDAADVDQTNSPKNSKKLFNHLLVRTNSFQADLNRSHLEQSVLVMKARVHSSLSEATPPHHPKKSPTELTMSLKKNASLRSRAFERGFKKMRSESFIMEQTNKDQEESLAEGSPEVPASPLSVSGHNAAVRASKFEEVDDSDNESDCGSVISAKSVDSNATRAPSDHIGPSKLSSGPSTTTVKTAKKSQADDDSESSAFPVRLKTVKKKISTKKRPKSPTDDDTVIIHDKEHASFVSLKEVGESGSILMSITEDKDTKIATALSDTATAASRKENFERRIAVGGLAGSGVVADRRSPATFAPEGELSKIVKLQKPVKKFELCPPEKRNVQVSIEADRATKGANLGGFWDQDIASLQYHTLDMNNFKLGVVVEHGVKRTEKFYYDYENGDYVRLPPPRTASPERTSDLVPPEPVGVFEGMIPAVPSTLLRVDGRDKVHVVASANPNTSADLVERAVQQTRNAQPRAGLNINDADENDDFDYEEDAVALAYQTILDYHETLDAERQREMLDIFIKQQEYEQTQALTQQLMYIEALQEQEKYSPTRGNKCQEETNISILARSRSHSPEKPKGAQGSDSETRSAGLSRFGSGTGTIDGIAAQMMLDTPGLNPDYDRMSPVAGSPQEIEASVFANLLEGDVNKPSNAIELMGSPVRLKSRQEDRSERKTKDSLERQALLSSRKSTRTGSPSGLLSDDEQSVVTKDSVELGDNRQFSISVEMRPGVLSPGTDLEEEEVEVPMDGVNRPYSRQVMSAVTPSGRKSLQDYFKDPEFDLTESVRASRAERRELDGAASEEGSLSDAPPAMKTLSPHEFPASPENVRIKIVNGSADDATELTFHTSESNSVSLPSIFPVRGPSAGGSRPMSSDYSYDEDDEEYMEMELRNMLAQTQGRSGSQQGNQTITSARVGESQSLPQLPGIVVSTKPKVHVPKARKIFGSADVSTNKKKPARQGTLLSVSDSMPLLPPGDDVDTGLELRSAKPHMVDRYKALSKKRKKN